MVWRRRTTAAAFSRGLVLGRSLSAEVNGKIGCCQVIEVDAIPPDTEARKAFVEFLKLPFIASSVVIHDGSGFKAASVRAIVNLQILVSKPKFPHGLFSSVKQAAMTLAAETSALAPDRSAATLEALISELRALHRSRFP